jgi:hypothetical protein
MNLRFEAYEGFGFPRVSNGVAEVAFDDFKARLSDMQSDAPASSRAPTICELINPMPPVTKHFICPSV